MPNWCYTNITINHENETEVEKLEKLIDEWTSKDYMPNGFNNKWLGNVVLGSGVGTVDINKETDLRCRGTIIDYYRIGNELVINTETAWSPMLQMWVKVIEKYLPGAELIYNADECGFDINDTNDPALVGKYILDYYGDEDIESDFEASEDTVRETLQKMLDTTETDVEKLINMVFEDDLDISVRKWEYSDVSNWD